MVYLVTDLLLAQIFYALLLFYFLHIFGYAAKDQYICDDSG